eukprot:363936-Chlamydomonas_euryale.AAC.6
MESYESRHSSHSFAAAVVSARRCKWRWAAVVDVRTQVWGEGVECRRGGWAHASVGGGGGVWWVAHTIVGCGRTPWCRAIVGGERDGAMPVWVLGAPCDGATVPCRCGCHAMGSAMRWGAPCDGERHAMGRQLG